MVSGACLIIQFIKYGVAMNIATATAMITVQVQRANREKYGLCHSNGKARGPTSKSMTTT